MQSQYYTPDYNISGGYPLTANNTISGLRDTATDLEFRRPADSDIEPVRRLMSMAGCRTCDFTVGGIFMWIDYFKYRLCIVDDTLFVKGVTENDRTRPCYSLPVGKLPLATALEMMRSNCGTPLVLSAVPGERLEELLRLYPDAGVTELTDWADYLYDIEAMSSFAGKKLSKKRNHVNRFRADHPDYVVEPLTQNNVADAAALLQRLDSEGERSQAAELEMRYAFDVLCRLDLYRFEGALLRPAPGAQPVAFTVGEVAGDTLYAHIEKMDHSVNGSGETISSSFCSMMRERYPALRYVNREDAAGDPGLKRAKEAYQPLMLLPKYNVVIP